ncbi:hypothetical protein Glove_411g11 [Diversispora epigaea]|uniref:Uncharacterized protein n=1 Tax=Diversispora epigaea TaxID=1348612 RepID=A0A397GXI5_9GLOM|nr:hypothetical protein Glove_411g11 [Diversispora epigaea]
MIFQNGCWDDDPFKRPTINELPFGNYICDEFLDADDNREIMNKSHEQKLIQSLYNFHPQFCYIIRPIYTLYGLKDSLEDIKFEKCAATFTFINPNLHTYDIDFEELSSKFKKI